MVPDSNLVESCKECTVSNCGLCDDGEDSCSECVNGYDLKDGSCVLKQYYIVLSVLLILIFILLLIWFCSLSSSSKDKVCGGAEASCCLCELCDCALGCC